MQNDASGSGCAAATVPGEMARPVSRTSIPVRSPSRPNPATRVPAGIFVAGAVIFTGVGFGATLVIRDQLAPSFFFFFFFFFFFYKKKKKKKRQRGEHCAIDRSRA